MFFGWIRGGSNSGALTAVNLVVFLQDGMQILPSNFKKLSILILFFF